MTCIVIVTFNNFEDTKQCIDSCLLLSTEEVTIVVVDNGSSDNSPEKLLLEFNDKIHLIKLPVNSGYARANNVGISYAINNNIKYIWLINNDTIVTPESLNYLINSKSTIKEESILGSKILNWPPCRKTIDFLGGTYDSKNGTCTHLHRNSSETLSKNNPILSDFITGCSIFFTPYVIQRVGLIPENYFLYCEDVDWCLTARSVGISSYVIPNSIVYHKLHLTTAKYKNTIIYYNTRNNLFLLEKINCCSEVVWRERFFLDLKALYQYIFKLNLRGAYNIVRAYLSWIRGMQGPEFNRIKMRRNIFSKLSKR